MTTKIERVTVLNGHTSQDSAYVQDDYPYGRRLRCKRRVWVETAAKGQARGQQRFVYQTSVPPEKDPCEPWNTPHPSQYSVRVWMYLDGEGHVQTSHLSWSYIRPGHYVWLRMSGVLEQVSDADRALVQRYVQVCRERDATWQQWDTLVAYLAEQIAAGTVPALVNRVVDAGDGRRWYVDYDREYETAVAAAHAMLTGEPVTPATDPGECEQVGPYTIGCDGGRWYVADADGRKLSAGLSSRDDAATRAGEHIADAEPVSVALADGSTVHVRSGERDRFRGLDADGNQVYAMDGGDHLYPVTPCCQASGKGSDGGVVCRACYKPVSAYFGGGVEVAVAVQPAETDPWNALLAGM